MRKIYILILTLAAGYTYSDMNIISYSSADFDVDNTSISHTQDQISFSSYNSSSNAEWDIGVYSGEYDLAGTVFADTDVFKIGFSQFYGDRSIEAVPYARFAIGTVSLSIDTAAIAYESDSSVIQIGGGYSLVPEEGFGYDVNAGLFVTLYDDDASDGVALATETDLAYGASVSYALSNGIRFTAGFSDTTREGGTTAVTAVGIGYQF